MTQVQTMTKYEMAEQLAEKMHITLEEASAALEQADWNVLTATHLLEQEQFRRKQELNAFAPDAGEADAGDGAEAKETVVVEAAPRSEAKGSWRSGLRRVGRAVRDLIALGNRTRFAIHRNGEQLLEMPVTVLALLLLFSFGTCALLLVGGLLLGCHYSVNGSGVGVEA